MSAPVRVHRRSLLLGAAALPMIGAEAPRRTTASAPPPGPMDSILLKDYEPDSSLVVPEHHVPKARVPAIDVHSHDYVKTPEEIRAWVRRMDEVGVEVSVILSGWGDTTGARFDRLVDLFLKPYPTRFQLYCGLDTTGFEKPDYPERAVAELVRCYENGARGVGELVDKGSGLSGQQDLLPPEKRLHPDDPRLDAFWQKCAELQLPVNLHIADHPSSWQPPDIHQERLPAYQRWNQHGRPSPSYEELLVIRDRLLAKHPNTVFVACHLSNQGNDLASLGQALDRFPNLYLDTSARDYELGRQPRTAAKFLTRYKDRVLFGTDLPIGQKSMYESWWRLFETADEYMPGPNWWRHYGLELPDAVLESLYRANARRIMNWETLSL
ncbi:MAG: amidohydrolase family protein [Luteitalea sp.]|nr:amidohydrolase family protein [Luteitalea sp.]